VHQVTLFDDFVELAEGVYEAACESAVDWTEGLGSYVLLITGRAESLSCAPLGLVPDWDAAQVVHALRPLVGGRVTGTILCASVPEAAPASGRDARRVIVGLRTRDGGRWMPASGRTTSARSPSGSAPTGMRSCFRVRRGA